MQRATLLLILTGSVFGQNHPEPIRVVTGEEIPPEAVTVVPIWLILLAIISAGIVIASVLCLLWLIRTRRQTPAERAFERLSRKMGLARRHRALVRALADAHGRASPVALLVSHHAFTVAANRNGNDEQTRSLASRLFAETT
jgi:hypothetical protein